MEFIVPENFEETEHLYVKEFFLLTLIPSQE